MKWYWLLCSCALPLQGCGGDSASMAPVNPLSGMITLLEALTGQVNDLKSLVVFLFILAAALSLVCWGLGFFLGAGVGSSAKSDSARKSAPPEQEDQ